MKSGPARATLLHEGEEGLGREVNAEGKDSSYQQNPAIRKQDLPSNLGCANFGK